jgi:hypothetical protein
MSKIQKTKKQTEELNSSQIKEILLRFSQALRATEKLYAEGKANDFETHVSLAAIFNETSREITDACSLLGYNESIEDLLSVEDFFVQSGVDVTPEDMMTSGEKENVTFVDNDTDVISSIPHPMAYTKVDSSTNVKLGQFLQRPVQIFDTTWQIGTHLNAATTTFDPWHAFFNHPSIKRKLDNYYMVRCNLHLKFVINASPFYYGAALTAYQPMVDYLPGNIVQSVSNRLENVLLSQRPHLYLYPQNSQGGEMVLPFIYPKNWMDATSAANLTSIGS